MQYGNPQHSTTNRKWIIAVVVFVLISLIIIYNQQDDAPLDAPTGAGVSSVAPSEEVEKDKIELDFYENEKHSYKIGVPNDWTKVVKDGCDTFVHSPSATSVQVQVFDYSPALLFVNQDSVAAELSSAGYQLSNFGWTKANSFSSIYTKADDFVYSEITTFDREKAIRLYFVIDQTYVNKVTDFIAVIIDNFKWEPKNPFPAGTVPKYSEYGSYEFVYPEKWNTAISGNAYLAQDPTSGATMSISANQSNATYESMSNIDYVKFASNGRPAYVLKSFTGDKHIIYAQGTYNANNVPMVLVQYLIATGKYEYTLTFDVPQTSYQALAGTIQDIIQTFRIY